MRIGKVIVFSVLGLLAICAGVIAISYWHDMAAARARISAGSRAIDTKYGRVEYGEAGDGPPVLVLHGAGGGYDQGLRLGSYLVGEGYRIIAPSRFGYAGTPIPADSSLEAQADAYVSLLDELGIAGPVPVIAFSAGGPSGLTIAVQHADRVRRLVMVSAVSYREEPDRDASPQGVSINTLIGGNFVYWAANKALQPMLLKMLGVSRNVQASFSPETRTAVRLLMAEMHPMALRLPGTLFDQKSRIPRSLAARVSVPTLVVHCEDDGLVPFSHGQHTHAAIAGSRLVTYPTGGHLLAGRYEAARETVRAFLEELK
jgi:pimeloyl-ACP methyl ester carboxylesterase